MASAFANELTYFSDEINRIKRELAFVDSISISSDVTLRARAALIKAFVYVWLCDVLERTVRDVLTETLRAISSTSRSYDQIRTSLFALLADGPLESIRSVNKVNAWDTKVGMFGLIASTDTATISSDVIPMGARTLRGEQFDRIWNVYGFAQPSLPSALHRVALKDLADGRNDVAHGHIEPELFGKSKAANDVKNLIGRVEDIGEHVILCGESYIDEEEYLRR